MLTNKFQIPRLPYREDKLFGLVFITLFLVPIFFLPLLADAFDIPRLVLFSIFVGLCLFMLIQRNKIESRMSKTVKFSLIAFTGLNFISLLFSDVMLNGFVGYFERHSSSLLFIVLWGIFIFLISLVNSKEKVLTLSRVFVASGFLVAALGILHSFSIGYYTGIASTTRPITPGFIGNQNFSAMFLLGVIPFLLPLFINAKTHLNKIFYGALGFVMIWALMSFGSRASILAIFGAGIIGLILLLIRKFSWSVRLGVLGVFLLTIIMAAGFYTTTRFAGIDTSLDLNVDQSTQARIEVWVQTVELIKQNPWAGVGLGNFPNAFNKLGNTTIVGSERFDDPHNLFLNIAVTAGIPTLLAFLLLICACLWITFKNFWNNQSLLSWSIFVALIGIMISSFFGPVAISIWIMLAFLVAASQFSLPAKSINEFVSYKKIIVVILGVLLILIGISLLASEFVSKFGIDSYRAGRYESSINYGNYALVLNPFNSYPKAYMAASMIKLQADPVAVREKINQLATHDKNSSSNLQLASALSLMLHDYSKDEQDLNNMFNYLDQQLKAEPNSGAILINSAYYAFRARNFEVATKYLNHAIAVDKQKQYSYAYLLLAEIQLEQGNLPAMFESLQNANKIAPRPGFKVIFDKYNSGTFTDKLLPIGYPPIDI